MDMCKVHVDNVVSTYSGYDTLVDNRQVKSHRDTRIDTALSCPGIDQSLGPLERESWSCSGSECRIEADVHSQDRSGLNQQISAKRCSAVVKSA